MIAKRIGLLCLVVLALGLRAKADAALLLEEPYGEFGQMNPTGHAAVYLPRVCADTPLILRKCFPGEMGVVISRYYKISGYDWVAVPLVAYLYAVDDPTGIPEFAKAAQVKEMRDRYRRQHLEMIAPDRPDGKIPGGEWTELVGEAYDRKIYGFEIETTEAQDERLIELLNQRANKRLRREEVGGLPTFLVSHNCADFARGIFNFYYPHSIHRNLIADLGITTPKQVARSLVKYARRHSDLEFSSFVIPQIPGSRHRSAGVDNLAEALITSKKYVVPLAFLHPFVAGGVAVVWLGEGRFNPSAQVKKFPMSPEIATLWEEREKAYAESRKPPVGQATTTRATLASPLQ